MTEQAAVNPPRRRVADGERHVDSRAGRCGVRRIARAREGFAARLRLNSVRYSGIEQMRSDSKDAESARPIGANLVTSWVLAAMLIILSTFLAQFPEADVARSTAVAAR